MEKANRGRLFLVCVLVFGAVFMWSTAWADFYVIAAGKKAKRTVLVSPQSTAVASGTALLNAQNGINDASVTNPYLIIIEPGVYDIGSNQLLMKSFVDIQGSGENVTKITGNVAGGFAGVLKGADDAELRFLTVENTGGGTNAHAIFNNGASLSITHVTATASGGTDNNCGVCNLNSSSPMMTHVTATASGGAYSYGVYNYFTSSPTMTDVTATASGGTTRDHGVYNAMYCSPTMTNVTATASGGTNSYGVYNSESCSPTMTNVTATASGGANNYGVYNIQSSVATIDHSVISGSTRTVSVSSTSAAYIANTRLNGGPVGTGTNNCAGVCDENYTFYPNTCP